MRVIVAIVLFATSVVTLGFGIAQRTLFADPQTLDRLVLTDTAAPAMVIHGKDLAAYPGRVTITIEGGVSGRVPALEGEGFETRSSDKIFLAYARTIDVMAWLSPARHTQVRFDSLTDNFYALPRAGAELSLPNPAGSDLWFQEYSDQGQMLVALSVPSDVSLLIMSDGVLPAPQRLTVSWPLVTETLWSIVLVVIGIATMVAGLVVVILSLVHWRRNRGPKRKLTKRPKPPRGANRPRPPRSSLKPRGRRAARFQAITLTGLVLGGATACTPSGIPAEIQGAPADSLSQAIAPFPAVTELQFSRIMSKIAAQVSFADEELTVNLLGARVADPTLQARRAAYIVKRADGESGVLSPILASPIRLVLPQQTTTWPRSVFGIIQDEQDDQSPSLGVVLRQEDPRQDYRLTYAVVLAPQVQIPDVPQASVGSAKLSRDSKLTKVSPAEVLERYASVINVGTESPFATDFSLATDRLFIQVGPDAAALRQESFGESVRVVWETSPTDAEIVAFSTADGGALVMGTLQEIERVAPVQSGASVNASIAVRALTALSQSVRGFEVQSNIQILWYVPPIGSDEGIRVLGFTYSLVGAKEVDSE